MNVLFKGSDPLKNAQSLTVKYDADEDEVASHQADVADASTPVISLDLSGLNETERRIIQARSNGETLKEIGQPLGLTAERIRQKEVRARSKIRGCTAAKLVSDLVKRGEHLIRSPGGSTRRWAGAEFVDRAPPKHAYREPQPSREIIHHRTHAPRLAALRKGRQ